MAVPKKKLSHARQASRRANWKLTAPNLETCPQCKEAKAPHHVCPHCGYYDGRLVVAAKDKSEEKGEGR